MMLMLLTFSSYAFNFIATCERVSFAMLTTKRQSKKKNDREASEEQSERKHLLDASKT